MCLRRFSLVAREIYFAGVLSLIIILVSGLFVGMVLGLQGYDTLERYGSSSALGVLVARGHPFAIATAFLAAPLTTLHPALAAGWFAGLVEAKIRIPLVKDFEGLNKLNSLSDLNNNRVTHILMVTALANLGATMGTLIAFPYLLSLLG